MKKKTTILIAGGVIAAASVAGVGVAASSSDDDGTEVPITGIELEQASKAALEHTGSDRVTETEVGDEDSFYEVEVTFDDGRQVDVQLDENFNVVDVIADDDTGEDGNTS